MKTVIVYFGLVVLSHLDLFIATKVDLGREWLNHKIKYALTYDEKEDTTRRLIFEERFNKIEEFNSQNRGSVLEMNKFGHMTSKEIFNCFHLHAKGSGQRYLSKESDLPIRKSMDWRKYQVVSSVKNQGHCGSCYSFSAIAAAESHFAIQTGVLEDMSEQEIVDCSILYGNNGCSGGFPQKVFQYMVKNGVSSSLDYNYTGAEGFCRLSNKNHGNRLLSYADISGGDEGHLVRTLSFIGPVSIALDVDHSEFIFYKSGVVKISNCSRTELNHAVLAVGYSIEKESYLIVKNSWGREWGEDGYFRIALFEDNMCGMATFGSYPIPLLSTTTY